jgi:dTDP-4-amino-4,6-dideoxygalactose transaminase
MSDLNGIPFLDLVTPHVELKSELTAVFQEMLHTAMFIGGPAVENFERDFAAFCDTRFSVGVASGTAALHCALVAAGIRTGDSVITVAHTFIATTEAISQAGALPEFVDIDERTYNLDPAKLRAYLENECDADLQTGRRISPRTGRPVTAVVPVHLYGQMADMDAILELAEEFNLIVIEDACQAHGAEYFSGREQRWRKAGSMGKAAAFSFYPGKNLGACGEAGAVTTNDAEVARKIRMIRDHGQSRKYFHDVEGHNGRLDAIQAGVLHTKLRRLDLWNEQRRSKAAEYNGLLSNCDALRLPYEPSWSRGVYHLYVVRTRDREGLMTHLKEAGIGSAIHYPVPLHLQIAYTSLGYSAGDFPVTERVAAEIVSLPMYPQLTSTQQEKVAREVKSFSTERQSAGITISTEPMVIAAVRDDEFLPSQSISTLQQA